MALHPRAQGISLPRPAAAIALTIAIVALLVLAHPAHAARTVFFADPGADAIAQYSVGTGGALSPLSPVSVHADDPRRLAMTRSGTSLYATAGAGVFQYDVAPDGRLTPKATPIVWAGGDLGAIAVHPDDASVYVADAYWDKVRQFDVGPGGQLSEKVPFSEPAAPGTAGLAVSPGGATVYVLVSGGIVVFDVGPGGVLARRAKVDVASSTLQDVALTPDGANLYATSRDGRVFQFDVAADGSLSPKVPAAVATGAGTKPVGIAVTPDRSAVYVAAAEGANGRVIGFSISAGGALAAGGTWPIASSPLNYLTASPDGKSLFAAGGDGHLFDIGAGAAIAPKPFPTITLSDPLGVVVSPNQPPIASFAAAASGVAGTPIGFDASGAVDPDGTIARYDWDFGDGTSLADGGPTPQHVYAGPGDYTVVLVVTDNEGASTTTIFTGGTALGNGEPVAQASRVIQIAPPPPPPAPAQELVPDLGETLVADPLSGTVRVRLPGTSSYVGLSEVRELPLGSVLDTRRGRVEVATIRRKRGGRVQRGRFYGGVFQVQQRRRDKYVTVLALRGALPGCRSEGDASAAAAAKKRRVWGDGEGRFRTRGRYSSGAVRGTKWLTEDRCDGTFTLVRRGRVAVRDFVLKKTVILRRGQRYLAQPR
jgi:DNA-binding beta-propeller fold protein YncE